MYLVCGEALFDVFLGDDEGEPGALQFNARAGGSPFNVAIGIARLGGRASLLTSIATDMLGRRLVKILQRELVSTDYLLRSERRTTLSMVSVDDSGQPEYAFYGEGSADCSVQPSDLPEIETGIQGLHFGSYSLVVRPVADAFACLVAQCGDRFVSLDPNIRPTIEADMDIWRDRVDEYIGYSDLIKISEEDMKFLYPGVPRENKVVDWLDRGVSLAVITDGGNDCVAWTKTGDSLRKPIFNSEVVDTVGGGDSFQAALLARLAIKGSPKQAVENLDAESLEDLITYALAAASLTCSRRGADLPSLDDVYSVIKSRA
jgi:fructokinase